MLSFADVPRWGRLAQKGLAFGLLAVLSLSTGLTPVNAQQAQAAGTSDCSQAPAHFGRLFPNLPAARWSTDAVTALSTRVMAAAETEPTPENEVDDEENLDIDAGYTYVGQFIDHDLTLDPRPNDLTTPIDSTTLQDFRTPAFDLDSIYGAGPTGSPQLYEADGMHMKLGASLARIETDKRPVDLPRDSAGQAVIGDPRNDENRIVGGLHTIFLRFHNQIVDDVRKANPKWSNQQVFEDARRQVRDYYQMAVFTDFLPTVVSREALSGVLTPGFGSGPSGAPSLRFYKPCSTGMPVEFSVGAYRFGHSMVRALYRINTLVPRLPVFTLTNNATRDLGGFRPSPSNFAIDWSFFFLQDGQTRAVGKPQPSYKMDNSLVFPLSLLPLGDAGTGPTSLALRNLLRSEQLGLPSGQDVARAYGLQPLRDDQILVGKATGVADDTVSITSVAAGFAGKAPLWTYVLAEATAYAFNVHDGHIDGVQKGPMRLNGVGGRLVAETFVGLLAADAGSILYDGDFRPNLSLFHNGRFGFKDLIEAVTSRS